MVRCDSCKSVILFGGNKDSENELNFCGIDCEKKYYIDLIASEISESDVYENALDLFNSDCLICGKRRNNNLYKSHTVTSFLIFTNWKTHEHICCKVCAAKKQSKGLIHSLVLGWWGIPWGVMITPIFIIKNLFGILSIPKDDPNNYLKKHVKNLMAETKYNELNNNLEIN